MRCIFFSRFQSCRIIPIVMMSALGSGSLKKSPAAVPIRSLKPAAPMDFLATGSTGGRSKLTQLIPCLWAVPFPLQEPHRHERLEELSDSARVQPHFAPEF